MRSLCLAVLLAFAAGAAAQVPKGAAARIKEIGPVLNPEMIDEMFKLYTPLMPKAPAGVAMKEDIAYGDDERQKLDLFAPETGTGRTLPVVIFVHGGGFVGGAKSRPGIPFYKNVGYFFARNRVVGVNMTYRLAPKHPWPAGGEDVAAAVRWVHKNIAEYGGDPERIVLFGHSAGAMHVAHYIFDESLQPKDRADGVKGAILQSGIFDPAAAPPGPNIAAYFGKEREGWHAKSVYGKLAGRKIALFIVSAELDPQPFKDESAKLRDELCKLRGCPRHTELAGHNHMSEILHLNTADDSVGNDILGFVRFPR